MSKEDPVKKWTNCKHSLSIGHNDEEGYALREEGFIEKYGCDNPRIVDNNNHPTTTLPENGDITRVAVLHGFGKIDNPEVINDLDISCGTCQSFQKRD